MHPRLTRAIALALALPSALAPSCALAHTGLGDGHGVLHGFAHPLGGLDHVLAMVAVGVLAWQLGGRALWLLPATFVLVMALAGMLGLAGIPVPLVEAGIAISVIALGAMIALGVKAPLAFAGGIIALFAVFHGHAHGGEMPLDVSAASYAAGFMLATMLLHLTGIALGILLGRMGGEHARAACRFGGAAVALAGIAILMQVV